MRKFLLLTLALLGVAVLTGFDYSGDCSAANGGCLPGDPFLAANGNEIAIALNLLEARTFDSDLESSADGVGGFANAVTTCEANPSGGVVIAPRGIVSVNRTAATEVPPLTKCHIAVDGGAQVSGGGPAGQYVQGSVFRLSGTAANPFIRIEGDGIYVGPIGIEFLTPDASNIGIKTSDAAVGSNFLSGVVLDRVVISGQNQGSSVNGIGLLFEDCLKCEVRGGEYKRMTAGVQINGGTQASPLFGVKTRENAFGVEFASTWDVFGATQSIFGLSSEGNTQQVRVQASANGTIELFAPYFEPSASVGVQAERAGILTNSALAVLHVYGGSMMAQNGVLDPSRDFVQTVNQSGLPRGPHVFDGFKWVSGGSTLSGSTTEVLVRNALQVGAGTYSPAFVGGRWFGDTTYRAVTNCQTEMAAEGRFFYGDQCLIGTGAGAVRWECLDPDGATANGYCDNSAEIVQSPGGGGGSSTFLGLTDTPSSYAGAAGRPMVVNSGETALEATQDVPGSNGLTIDDNPTGNRPGTPAAGTGIIYAVDDGNVYYKNDAGTESQLNAGGVSEIFKDSAYSMNMGNVLTDECSEVTQTASGVLATDIVDWNFASAVEAGQYQPTTSGGISLHARAAAGQIIWEACNSTAGSVDPVAVTLRVKVHR